MTEGLSCKELEIFVRHVEMSVDFIRRANKEQAPVMLGMMIDEMREYLIERDVEDIRCK